MNTLVKDVPPERYVRLARSLANRFHYADDADVFGDALLALVEAAKAWLPGAEANFVTYARRCILNALISSHRKSILRHYESLLEEPAACEKPPCIDPEIMDQILLPPEDEGGCRDHVMMLEHYLGGKSQAQIARENCVTRMAVCYAVRRGIARIRRDHARLLASDAVGLDYSKANSEAANEKSRL